MTVGEAGRRRRKALIAVSVACLLTLPFAYSAVVVPLSAWEQAEVSLLMIGLAMLASLSRPMRPLIVFLSGFASLRYFYWRVTSTLTLDGALEGSASMLLLGAEVYGVLVLFLGYFQTIALERRPPSPLRSLPSVDIFVPTYNESIEIVRRTLIGTLALDYPRKQVFLLDDGRRETFESMARELGCFYLTRPDNAHAKAGNLNRALKRTHGELVAIFDADHVPVRGFLRQTVGFFEDTKVALVQAAQHFFNPDPFERNLNLQGRIAPEQTFFYHVIQPGNDFWNSAFFCGSCAVLRRSAIEAIGGFKVETVTEDAHTALELHARGWRSVYLALPLAAGLATESFAAHVTQRTRWARGMAQILRLDCPLFKRGLSLPQRLNYTNAMLHFFFGFPCLIMIAAPLLFLLLGIHSFRADVIGGPRLHPAPRGLEHDRQLAHQRALPSLLLGRSLRSLDCPLHCLGDPSRPLQPEARQVQRDRQGHPDRHGALRFRHEPRHPAPRGSVGGRVDDRLPPAPGVLRRRCGRARRAARNRDQCPLGPREPDHPGGRGLRRL